MSAATAEDRSRNWLEMPADLVPLFELDCVPDPETRRTPRPQPRPRTEATGTPSNETSSARKPLRTSALPQPASRGNAQRGLDAPPLCTLPPAKPLPAPDALLPLKSEGWSFENRRPQRFADPSGAKIENDEPDFLREALKEIEDARAEKIRLAAAAQVAIPPAKTPKDQPAPSPILLDMAHPLHAELQHARKALRGAWVSMILLMLGVIGGVFYTSVRLEKSDQHIERLLSELDAERTVSTTYKQEVANLYRELSDVKAEHSRAAARQGFASTAE